MTAPTQAQSALRKAAQDLVAGIGITPGEIDMRHALTAALLDALDTLDDIDTTPQPVIAPAQPDCHQYQTKDGRWHGFIGDKHYLNTVADKSWPIRALYATPQPVIAPWVMLDDDELNDLWENTPDCAYAVNYDDQRKFAKIVLAAFIAKQGAAS